MAVKAINNLARLNRIDFTFLLFRVYPRMTKIDVLSLSIIKKAKAICVVIKEICCL